MTVSSDRYCILYHLTISNVTSASEVLNTLLPYHEFQRHELMLYVTNVLSCFQNAVY